MTKHAAQLDSMGSTETSFEVKPGLQIVNTLVDYLHESGIPYCHWKSNEHVAEGRLGITDLDVLFDRSRCQEVVGILSNTGFKRFVPALSRAYPAVEDYLAYDAPTGKLVHLHLHYELTLGEKNLKGYHCPWESEFLSTRLFDNQNNIYVADPNLELLLLMVRAALKIRSRDHVLQWLGHNYFRGDDQREFAWLKQRVDPTFFHDTAARLLSPICAGILSKFLLSPPSFRELIQLRRCLHGTFRHYRTYGRITASYRRWLRELHVILGALNRRYLHLAQPTSRVPPTGGLLVAFLGPDGSGKSTLAEEAVRCLSWKTDVLSIYFGSGDGPSGLIRLPLKLALNLLTRLRTARGDAQIRNGPSTEANDYTPSKRENIFIDRARLFWALALSFEKRGKLRKAIRARNRGIIVICDRFPQNQIVGFNDGPLLSKWLNHRMRPMRLLARWERAPYDWAEASPPDLVIKLDVSSERAVRRKPEMTLREIDRRSSAVKALNYPPTTKTLTISADAPLDQVLLDAKQAIWNAL